MGYRRALGTIATTAALLVGMAGAEAQQDASVDVQDNEFVEPEVVIAEGDTVEWIQSGSNPHSVTADDGSFDSHPNCLPACMGEGDRFSQTFDTAGEYPYYCKIHGGPGGQGMSGVIRVEAAAQPEPTTTTTEAPVTSTTAQTESTTTPPETTAEDAPAPVAAESAERLPDTGTPVTVLLLAGALAAVLGAFAVRVTRRRA